MVLLLVFVAAGFAGFGAGWNAARARTAERNLPALLAAEERWHQKNGEWFEFSLAAGDSIQALSSLNARLPARRNHDYAAFVDERGVLVITAEGNLDRDPDLDRWRITSDAPSVVHVADDLRQNLLFRTIVDGVLK